MKELNYLDITKTTEQGHIVVPSATGIHPDMGVGTAQQIQTNIHETNSVPYVFRKTPYNATREKNTYVGVSVPWNQLGRGTLFSNRTLTLGLTITASNSDDSITVNGTASATNNLYFWTVLPTINGHVYFFQGAHNHSGNNGFQVSKSSSTTVQDTGNGAIFKPSSTGFQMQLFFTSGDSFTNEKFYPQLFDLTLALGSTIADYIYTLESGTAGAGVAKLREWGFFDKPYYAYNAGGIESVNVSKHRMVGFNQWDEEWEQGHYSTAGVLNATSNAIHSKNFTPCFPNTDYYCYLGKTGAQAFLCWYDNGQNFISRSAYINNEKRTSPANAAYFKMTTDTNYGTVYLDDICISIDKGTNVGIYEPYNPHEYSLADLTLRGILKLDGSNNLYADGDVYESDGTVTRKYGIIDLGSLEWTYYTSGSHPVFRVSVSGRKYGSNASGVAGIAQDYVFVGNDTLSNIISAMPDKSIGFQETNAFIMIRDDSYTSEATFKTAMNGKYLVYPLATPTTETADPYTNPQVCSPYGTEEFVDAGVAAGTRDVSIPVGHNTEYMKNIVGAIEGIPFPPSSNGTYTLKVTVASGVPTYSWVSG